MFSLTIVPNIWRSNTISFRKQKREHFTSILWGLCYTDNKTKDITEKRIYRPIVLMNIDVKNLHKSNAVICKKYKTLWPSEVYPSNVWLGQLSQVTVISCLKWLNCYSQSKWQNSKSIHDKTFYQTRIIRNFKLVRCIWKTKRKKPTTHITLSGKRVNAFPLRQKSRQGCLLSCLLLNLVVVILISAIRQEK